MSMHKSYSRVLNRSYVLVHDILKIVNESHMLHNLYMVIAMDFLSQRIILHLFCMVKCILWDLALTSCFYPRIPRLSKPTMLFADMTMQIAPAH